VGYNLKEAGTSRRGEIRETKGKKKKTCGLGGKKRKLKKGKKTCINEENKRQARCVAQTRS